MSLAGALIALISALGVLVMLATFAARLRHEAAIEALRKETIRIREVHMQRMRALREAEVIEVDEADFVDVPPPPTAGSVKPVEARAAA